MNIPQSHPQGGGKMSFDVWEYRYFPYLIELYSQFSNHFQDILDTNLDSKHRFKVFNTFIYKASSKQLSYIEPLTDIDNE